MSIERVQRVGLVALGAPQAGIGLWALLAPRDWYDSFPGGGREWLPAFGPYNEHFAADAGSGLLAAGLLVLVAAVVLERRVVQVALVGWLAFAIPHTVYHLTAFDTLDGTDNALNLALLSLTIVVPIALLAGAGRLGRPAREEVP